MWCALRAKERGPFPIFPPAPRDALCSWLVHDCLSRFGSSDPFLTISYCCCAFIFVSVFLAPLPSVPVSVDYTNPLCLLLNPTLVPTRTLEKQLCAAAICMDSPATPWRDGHTWQRMQPPGSCLGTAPATCIGKSLSWSLHPSTPA